MRRKGIRVIFVSCLVIRALLFSDALTVVQYCSGQSAQSGSLQQDQPIRQLGFLSLPGFNADVWGHKGFAYVGSWGGYAPWPCPATGVRIIDVSDPAKPQLVGAVAAIPNTRQQKVEVISVETPHFQGDLLAVGIQACSNVIAAIGGIDLWDVTDPRVPLHLAFWKTVDFRPFSPPGPHELHLFQRGDRAFVAAAVPESDRGFRLVEVTDPRAPVQIADWDVTDINLRIDCSATACYSCESAWVNPEGRFAVLSYWDAGAIILDISQPTKPVFVGRTVDPSGSTDNTHSGVLAHEGQLLVTTHELEGGPPWGYVRLWDIRNPGHPVQIGSFSTPNSRSNRQDGDFTVHYPVVRGNTLFLSWYSDGVRVVDISQPSEPREVGAYVPPGIPDPYGINKPAPDVWGVALDGDLILLSDTNAGLYVLENPVLSSTFFVPILLSAAGANNSFFTSELTLTNREATDATLEFHYTAAFGAGTGTVSDRLLAGSQLVHSDAIGYLRSLGLAIPDSVDQGGTLTINSSRSIGATVRTTSVTRSGRAGLAYQAVSSDAMLSSPSYLAGLRQNATDRSNVAIQNAGTADDGDIVLRLTLFSGDATHPMMHILPDEILPPGGFKQFSGILEAAKIDNGYVRVERVNGTAPYFAYAVINDQSNSDGSFVPPVLASDLTGRIGLTLPVIVETSAFQSELVLTNYSASRKTIGFDYVARAIDAPDNKAHFVVDLLAGEQKILPNLLQMLRDQGVPGINSGSNYVGALFATVKGGDTAGLFVAARTSAQGDGGRYGLFYTATAQGTLSSETLWLFGLQQTSETRTNLALVNTGEIDSSPSTFSIDLFNGSPGAKVASFQVTVPAKGWNQVLSILSQYAPGVLHGYARVRRVAGNNPFLAYAVLNDGGQPGQRTGDGAFVWGVP